MRDRKWLIILDVDHTLLHAWVTDPVMEWLSPDDPFKTPESRQQYKTTLLEKVHGAWHWNDLVICPRPYISKFESFLLSQPRFEVAFYSTAAPVYLETILPRVVPKLYKQAKFVWGKNKCPRLSEVKMPYKDLNQVAEEFDVDIEHMVMVDDLPTIIPWCNRLDIARFNISQDVEPAQRDVALLRLIKRLEHLLKLDCGIHSQRIQEMHNERDWENLKNLWLTINKRKSVLDSDYPVPRPLPFDYVPDSRDAIQDLLDS